MLNNFQLILDTIEFNSPDDFYFMQLIQRRKENPDMKQNSRALKNYLIRSKEKLIDYMPDIIGLSNYFNARATIRLNRRSYRQCAFESLRELAKNLADNDYRPVDKVSAQVMGKFHADPVKKWLLDVDDISANDSRINEIIEFVSTLQPIGNKHVVTIPSRTGCHIITTAFDPRQLRSKYPDIEIIKDGPTNIYIP